jgi:hypothetical protein
VKLGGQAFWPSQPFLPLVQHKILGVSLWQCFDAPFETGDWRCGGIVQSGVFSHRQEDTSTHKPGDYRYGSHNISISIIFP